MIQMQKKIVNMRNYVEPEKKNKLNQNLNLLSKENTLLNLMTYKTNSFSRKSKTISRKNTNRSLRKFKTYKNSSRVQSFILKNDAMQSKVLSLTWLPIKNKIKNHIKPSSRAKNE